VSRFQLVLIATIAALALLVRPCSAFAPPRKLGGFGSSSGGASPPAPAAADDGQEVAEQVARQLFGICSHLQDPELYTPSWSHTAEPNDAAGGLLVATKDIARGDIVTLYPVHSLGLRGSGSSSKKKNKKAKKGSLRSDYLIYDSARDGEFFGSQRRTTKHCIDFPALTDRKELRGQSLFLDASPERELVPGWMGHMCERGAKDGNNANCAAIPLQGVAPLLMIVATRDVAQGELLVRDVSSNEGAVVLRERITESGNIALAKYAAEIAELASYTNMAYPKDGNGEDERRNLLSEETAQTAQTFKKINLQYPGIQAFHRDPDIFCVDNFLTEAECDRIVAKCKPHMAPCVTKDPVTGVVGPDPRRTSTEAMLPQSEAPSIVSKLVKLLDCREDELEILQVLRYKEGQEFQAHTDGFAGPTTAAGFANSGRLVTLFAYLSNVQTGGHTEFVDLKFSVAPQKGSAVIHFPASEQLQEDTRTVHRGMPAGVDEKWILATWVWQTTRTDPQYAEKNLQKLSEDII